MFLSKLVESIGEILAPINPFANDSKDDKPSGSDPVSTKRRRLDAQKKAETLAESNGVFAKKQRVFYHNKSTDTMHDAYIVGVHFDDGPDKPYYTISYKKQQETVLEDGTKQSSIVEVEKQTTPDRLDRVEWDEEKSWRVLSGLRGQ